ncbi:MAG TPA: hypothetical protein VF723_06125 [Pyrinomonadaceae bacterium]|jgi:hypothetical protein
MEIEHFINEGYGWTCKHCGAEDRARRPSEGTRGRFFDEGEAEEKEPRLQTRALARWTNATHRALRCPRCGVEEELSRA